MSLSEFFWKALRRAIHATGLVKIILLSEKGRLTQFVVRLEPQIRMKRTRVKWLPPWVVAVSRTPDPNRALGAYFGRSVFFLGYESSSKIRSIVSRLGGEPAYWRRQFTRGKDAKWRTVWDTPLYASENLELGRVADELLDSMGLQHDAPLVLLATRDQCYYRMLRATATVQNVGREALDDTELRNPNVDSYLLACRRLRHCGYSVVRVGTHQAPLSAEWSGVAVDYSSSFRTEIGDLALAARAAFLLNGASGFWALTSMFNRPQFSSNTYSYFRGTGVSIRDQFSPQLLRRLDDGSLLSFRDLAKTRGALPYRDELRERGLVLVKNSAEELVEMTMEMVQRVSGSLQPTPEDLNRERQFESIRGASSADHELGRISSVFLRRYEHLLD